MEKNNEFLELVDTMMEKSRDQIKKLEASNKIELNSIGEEINDSIGKMDKKFDSIQTNLDNMELKMKKNVLNQGSVSDNIVNHLRDKEFTEMVKNKGKGGGVDFTFTTPLNLNAAAVILDPTNFVAGLAPVVLPFREGGVDKAPTRPPLVSELIQWGTTTSNSVDWIERTAKTEGAGMRAEGGTMGQGDVTYTERYTKVKIASEYMKVTNESLKDVDFLASEINSELLTDLKLLVDTQLLSGDGTGNNLEGLTTRASSFVAGDFAYTVINANYADVLRVAINNIIVAGKGKWFPSAILMHPQDVTVLDLEKIADGRYIEIPFYDGENASVIKVPVIQNTGITAGKYLVGDFMKAKGFIRDALTIRVFDQNEDDPINNRSTITANVRLAFRVREQEEAAFIYGDFATDVEALDSVT